MKRITVLLLMFLCLVSCNSITDEIEIIENNKEYVVSIGVAGEILDVTQVPLSKASGDDLYGIQVVAIKKGESSGAKYAYGLFDYINNLSIKLLDGYTYNFIATCIIDGKNKIDCSSGKEGITYLGPFHSLLKNEFIFSLTEGLNLNYGSNFYPVADRYYGVVKDFDPSQSENIDIEMIKCMTSIKLIVSELKEGKLDINIKCKGDADYLDTSYSFKAGDESLVIEEIFAFYSLGEMWAYEKELNKGTYFDSRRLQMSYTDINGIETKLGEQDIVFYRNQQTVVKINNITNTESSATNKISISLENAGDIQPGEEIIID